MAVRKLEEVEGRGRRECELQLQTWSTQSASLATRPFPLLASICPQWQIRSLRQPPLPHRVRHRLRRAPAIHHDLVHSMRICLLLQITSKIRASTASYTYGSGKTASFKFVEPDHLGQERRERSLALRCTASTTHLGELH